MTDTVRRRIRYTGSPAYASMLMQMLREEGVEVEIEGDFRNRLETRGMVQAAEALVMSLVANGTYDAIKAGVTKFRKRVPRGKVDLEGEAEDD